MSTVVTVKFPPIPVQGWEYTQTVRTLKTVDEEENFFLYLLRLVWEIITCAVCFTGCPAQWSKRQIKHEIVETFRCTDPSQATVANARTIFCYLFAPMVPTEDARRISMDSLQPCQALSCTRRVANWGVEITGFEIKADNNNIMAVRDMLTNTSVPDRRDLVAPSVNAMSLQIRAGAQFVFSRDEILPQKGDINAIRIMQVTAICKWLGIADAVTGLCLLLDELLNNRRLPSSDGHWTVELHEEPDGSRRMTVTTYCRGMSYVSGDLQDCIGYLNTVAADLPYRAERFSDFRPLTTLQNGRLGYTISKKP